MLVELGIPPSASAKYNDHWLQNKQHINHRKIAPPANVLRATHQGLTIFYQIPPPKKQKNKKHFIL